MYSLRDTHKAEVTKEKHPHMFTNNETDRVHTEEVHPSVNTLYSYSGHAFRQIMQVWHSGKGNWLLGTHFGVLSLGSCCDIACYPTVALYNELEMQSAKTEEGFLEQLKMWFHQYPKKEVADIERNVASTYCR